MLLLGLSCRSLQILRNGCRRRIDIAYEVGTSFGDGDHRRTGVAADDGRHDGRVDHPEVLDPKDAELRVDDPANSTCTRRVIEGLRAALYEGPDVRLAAGFRREMRA